MSKSFRNEVVLDDDNEITGLESFQTQVDETADVSLALETIAFGKHLTPQARLRNRTQENGRADPDEAAAPERPAHLAHPRTIARSPRPSSCAARASGRDVQIAHETDVFRRRSDLHLHRPRLERERLRGGVPVAERAARQREGHGLLLSRHERDPLEAA